jgi:hypothetical protein
MKRIDYQIVLQSRKTHERGSINFTNGKIYIVNNKNPSAEAVAVKEGKLMEVGSARDIEKCVGKRTRIVDG